MFPFKQLGQVVQYKVVSLLPISFQGLELKMLAFLDESFADDEVHLAYLHEENFLVG
jgi:hypothetical protein